MRGLLCWLIALSLAACAVPDEVATPLPSPEVARVTATLAPTSTPPPTEISLPPSPEATATFAPSATALPPTPVPPSTPEALFPDPASTAAHQARLHPELALPDLAPLPHYVISATLEPPRLWGQMRLTLPNTGEVALNDVLLRLYGNGQSMYAGSRMQASDVRVAGQPAESQLEAGGSALRVQLPLPLEPGEQIEVRLNFETEVATGSFRGYGIQQMAQGIGVFGSPFPLLALRDRATWRVPAIPLVGDAASSPVALWDLFLRVPDDLTLVSSGEAVESAGGVTHLVTGPMRDVALVTLPASTSPIELSVSGVRLRYWPAAYVRGENFPARDAATVAAAAVQTFVAEFGPPPYAEMDVVEAQVPIGGYEYPGLLLFDGQRRAQADRVGIDFLVPHEIAHQWFYALVGNDVTREPWIDEGLATYAQLRYLHRVRGPEAALLQRQRWEAEYANALARRPVGVNRPLFGYDNWVSYRGPTYYASALLFDDLRQRLGDPLFREAMQRLATDYAFREVTTTQLRALFDEVAAAQAISLADIWPRWLE